MYILAIGWLYVTLLMAATEPNWVAALLSFTFYGLAPIGLLLWLFGTPTRRRRAAQAQGTLRPTNAKAEPHSVADQLPDQPDRTHPQ